MCHHGVDFAECFEKGVAHAPPTAVVEDCEFDLSSVPGCYQLPTPRDGAKLHEHRPLGPCFEMGFTKPGLFLPKKQITESINGRDLEKMIASVPVMGTAHKRWYLSNPMFIPRQWKERDKQGNPLHICFWGDEYCDLKEDGRPDDRGHFVEAIYLVSAESCEDCWAEEDVYLDLPFSPSYLAACFVA